MHRARSKSIAACVTAALLVAACAGSSESAPTRDSAPGFEAPARDVTVATSATDSRLDADADVEPGTTVRASSAPSVDPTPADTEPERPDTRYGTGDASILFDPSVVHTFDIGLDPDALAELDADPGAEEYVEGSLTFAGETLERVGVRYKGSVGSFLGCTTGPDPFNPSGAKTCTKLGLKLKINWDGADTEFYGQRRVQFHAMNLDQSMLRERLGYQMFRDAGVPAPRATHARVNVNGDFVGLFALVEQIDGRFTRDRFEDGGGNLYKEVWPFDDAGDVMDSDALIGSLRTNEDEDPDAEIIQRFARGILESGAPSDPDAARRVLEERTDLDAFVSYAVVDRAIRNDDGPFHWYCLGGPCRPHNFYFYEEPDAGLVHIIPWDLDNAFQVANPLTDIADPWGVTRNDCEQFEFGPLGVFQKSAACDPLVAAWSSLEAEFAETDAAFRSGPFAPDNVRKLIDEWSSQIAPIVSEAASIHDDAPTVAEWRTAVDQLIVDFVEPAEQEN